MGREVRCLCRWNSEAGEVKALLESRDIILLGHFRTHIPLAAVSEVRVDEQGLRFKVRDDQVVFEMRTSEAVQWAMRIATPPRTLRQQMGLSASAKALVLGRVKDVALKDALRDAHTTIPADATMVVAVVQDEEGLTTAIKAHRVLPSSSMMWIIQAKAARDHFGESRVRERLRSCGFVDTKVATVSSTLTATRYSKTV
jgi:hypothetical protein